jgi:signal transduction histidine kinase
LAYDVLSKFKISAKEKGVNLSVFPREQPIGVVGDIEKIERVLTNLVDNALRHCKPDDSVYIICREEGNGVNVRVCDTGSGIPELEVAKIFEPHYRATNARRGSSVNSGLGLAITKKLLAVQQVDIQVISKSGVGTYFTFTLPGSGQQAHPLPAIALAG